MIGFMTKTAAIDEVYLKFSHQIPKRQIEQIFNALFATASETLSQGKRVNIEGFGSFTVKETKARTGHNPRTREPIEIPAGHKVQFKVATQLKELLNP